MRAALPAGYSIELDGALKDSNSNTVMEVLVSASGCRMIKSEDAYYLEMGRLQAVEKAVQQKHRQLQNELKKMRGE